MATTTAGRQLSEAHRLAQARLGAQTVLQLRAVWPLLDPADLDGTFARWLQAVAPIVQAGRTASSALAGAYYQTFRMAEGAGGLYAPPAAGPASADALTGAMVITGPAQIRQALARGVPLAQAVDVAETMSAAAGQYHALQGGRDTITTATTADPEARGWARTTSGRCCAFCAMLAGRGFVYSATTVDFEAHPGCSCGAEPTFAPPGQSMLPPGSDRFRQQYLDATRGLPRGESALNAFRRAYQPAA